MLDGAVDDRPGRERERLGRRIGVKQVCAVGAELLSQLLHEVGWQLVWFWLGRKQGKKPT